jgi:tetratricopeptide (TPR) repeat protein
MKYLFVIIILLFAIYSFAQPTDSLIIKGNDAMYNKDNKLAAKYFDEYLKKNPDDKIVLVSLGAAYINLKNYSEAYLCFDKAVKLDSTYARAFSSRGACLLLFNEFDKAKQDLLWALTLDPEDVLTHNSLATLFAYQGDSTTAYEYYDKAISIDPKYLDTYWNRGAYYFNKDNYGKAFEDVNKAIEINPNIAKSFYFRGTLYKYTNQFEKSLEDYNTALKLEPDNGEAYVRRGILFLAMEQYQKAIDDLEYGYNLEPSLKEQTDKYYKEALQKNKK